MNENEAMTAKARAMFGERMKADQYEALLQKKNIAEIVAYLKTQPIYHSTLQGVNEKALHRGQLESLLRISLYERLQKLLRYGTEEDGRFLIGACMHTEIEAILMCLRSMLNQDAELRARMIAEMPIYSLQYLSFDIRKLADVTSYQELYELLKDTVYGNIIWRYSREKLDEIDFVALEHDLRMTYYRSLLDNVSGLAGGEALETTKHMISMQAELENITVIYRLKKYFKAPSERIRKQVTPICCLFTPAEIEHLIESGKDTDVIDALDKRYHHYIRNSRFSYIENYIERITYNIYYSAIRTSGETLPVMMSYLNLSLIEIRNLTNIVEGVRYGAANDRVRALLVYA